MLASFIPGFDSMHFNRVEPYALSRPTDIFSYLLRRLDESQFPSGF
jgi:hypothetical protein